MNGARFGLAALGFRLRFRSGRREIEPATFAATVDEAVAENMDGQAATLSGGYFTKAGSVQAHCHAKAAEFTKYVSSL